MVRNARHGSRWTTQRPKRRAAYDRYMKSARWAKIRKQWLADERERTGKPAACAVCGTTQVELHHLDYTRLGQERHNDLMPLCPAHHKTLHDIWDASYIWRQAGRRAASHGIIKTMQTHS